MSHDLSFTGERFVPGVEGEIVYEHVHRYAFARSVARGRVVLDAACGEGYGSALLADVAREVIGVDLDADAVAHAAETYRERPNLRFLQGSVASLPLADASVDLVVSFETIEHLPAAIQPAMIAEFARVLAPGGALVISSPNRAQYSEARGYRNPYHLHELDRDELAAMLRDALPAQRWFRQRLWMGSTVWAEHARDGYDAWAGDPSRIGDATLPEAMYFIVHAAADEASLAPVSSLSLFCDEAATELARCEKHARESMRLDALALELRTALDRETAHVQHLEKIAVERLEALDRGALHVQHLEKLVANREALLEQTRAALAAHERDHAGARKEREDLATECQRLERALAAQERIIAHRQSLRWWLELPWLRAKLWWNRLGGA